jgi:hypothetical protein
MSLKVTYENTLKEKYLCSFEKKGMFGPNTYTGETNNEQACLNKENGKVLAEPGETLEPITKDITFYISEYKKWESNN